MSDLTVAQIERMKMFEKNKRSIDEIGGVIIKPTKGTKSGDALFIGISPIGTVFCTTIDEVNHRVQFLDFVKRKG